eukprot:COSAG06_NODE_1208_length_10261_cov_5.380634_5_plen_130_part_00
MFWFLSQHYGVHNRMFVSFPGSSWPNHLFAQSATSCGIAANVMYNKCGGKAPQFPQMTIYDSLALADVPFGMQRISLSLSAVPCTNADHLPRQARDKHNEKFKMKRRWVFTCRYLCEYDLRRPRRPGGS